MKISKKMILSFLFIILVSLLIVGTTYNLMIKKEFNNFLVQEQYETHNNIAEEINTIFKNNNYVIYPRDLNYYSNLEDVDISITNLDQEVISSCFARNKGMHNHGHMNRNNSILKNDDNYKESQFPLIKNDQRIGNIVIGFVDSSYLTDNAQLFLKTLRPSLLISGVLASIIGLIVSLFISNSLTKPIITITKTAGEMTKGNFTPCKEIKSKTKEINELSKSINELGKNLKVQEKIRKRYASDISHELRTPITTIQSHLEAIIDGIWEPNEKHLNILISEVHRLSNLVDDLNKSFSHETYFSALNIENFNLSKEVEKIAITYNPILQRDGYNFSYDIEGNIFIDMDIDKLNQIIFNILSNAKNHMNRKGDIHLNLYKDENYAKIIIQDNGIGIKNEDLPYVLDRFYKSDSSRSSTSNSSGIGLSIVNSFVKEHGGELNIESEYNIGTKVTIKFPLKKASN